MPNTGTPGTVEPGAFSDWTDFETALTASLKANPNIAAIVGTRVYPLAIPEKRAGQTEGSLPCLVYAITGTDRARNLSGPAGVAIAHVLIDCRGKEYSQVKRLQEILRQYDGFNGYLYGSLYVMNTVFSDQSDEFEWPGGTGTGQGTYHITVSFRWKYREPLVPQSS
jgi:hypothetical protein